MYANYGRTFYHRKTANDTFMSDIKLNVTLSGAGWSYRDGTDGLGLYGDACFSCYVSHYGMWWNASFLLNKVML